MIKCDICDKEFEAKRKDARYCSAKCRKKSQRGVKEVESVQAIKPGLFLVEFKAEGFTKGDFDGLLAQMNALPRSVPNGFYHFEYADDKLVGTATAGETVMITLTKDNIAPFDQEKKTKEIVSMPQFGIHSQPAEVVTKGNKMVITGNSHPKWLAGDPKEGSGGFFMKFGAFKYDDPEFKRS